MIGAISSILSNTGSTGPQKSQSASARPSSAADPDHESLSLEDSHALLRRIFNLAPAGIAISRLRDDYLVDVNPAFCELLGYSREELVGSTSFSRHLWENASERISLIQRIKEEKTLHQEEMTLRTKSGSLRTVLASYQLISLQGERCVLGVLNDMTQRKETERKLRATKEEAEKMARIRTSILTNMTHEVRTPLTVILGFTSVLREGVREEYHRFIQLIERSGQRLLLMLDTILDLAQLEAGTLDPNRRRVDVNAVIAKAAEKVRPAAEAKKLRLDAELPSGKVFCYLDHEIFAHVLANLLDNAIKFTKSGGITLYLKVEDDELQLRVSDTGIGIEEDYLPRIFDEFSQASTGLDRTHQGAGLGLVVSKRLIEQLGGSLSVNSIEGEGSTFKICLPVENPADPGVR